MPKPDHANPEIAALEAQWWKDWWAADYSWDGLAGKKLLHVLAAEFLDIPKFGLSFQDYWRNEESHLIAEPGTNRRWTRLHCPLVFADGTPSPKQGWTEAEWDAVFAAIPSVKLPVPDTEAVVLEGAVLPKLRVWFSDKWLDLSHAYVGSDYGEPSWGLSARHTLFRGKVQFIAATFHVAQFQDAVFLSDFSALHTHFAGESNFIGARFAGRADFSEARFDQHAQFDEAQFAGPADFFGVRFGARALFNSVQCLDDIGFYKTAFVRRLSINDASFYGRLNLEGATDGDPIAQSPQAIRLQATAENTGLTGTLDAAQGPTERSFRSLPKLHARRATFYEDANISNRDLLSPSTFRDARFFERARFHGSDIHANVNFHGAEFRKALGYKTSNLPKYPEALLRLRFCAESEATNFAAWKKAYLKSRVEHRATDFSSDGYFDSLEASFRTLKQLMEDRRDRVREGEFFNLELQARRRRNDVPWWERVASVTYWALSDYGNSIFRPLFALAALYFALSVAYLLMGDVHGAIVPGLKINPHHLYSALGFSWNNVFSPFSVLDPQRFQAGDEWARALVLSDDPGFNLRVKILASVQSLLSLTLAFLAGLAGRRRFQIN